MTKNNLWDAVVDRFVKNANFESAQCEKIFWLTAEPVIEKPARRAHDEYVMDQYKLRRKPMEFYEWRETLIKDNPDRANRLIKEGVRNGFQLTKKLRALAPNTFRQRLWAFTKAHPVAMGSLLFALTSAVALPVTAVLFPDALVPLVTHLKTILDVIF